MSSVTLSNRGPKAITCLPCAKRKVRCDRKLPCSNCKRRKSDTCVYASNFTSSPTTSPNSHIASEDRTYVNKLEDYIRELGGDLHDLGRPLHASEPAEHRLKENGQLSSSNVRPSSSVEPDSTQATNALKTERSGRKAPTLINYEDQSVYIESPMWFSFNDVTKSDAGAEEKEQMRSEQQRRNTDSNRASPFNLFAGMKSSELRETHPPSQVIWSLWQKFLANVHPLVKIFFAWEIEALIEKAIQSIQSLSDAEQCLLFAIYFITCLSLSEDEILSLTNETKSNALDKFQSRAETSLQAVGFVGTTDRLVLQALVLYLLANRNRGNVNANYAMMGIAVRIAERLGLQRDGAILKLSPYETELRRRIWWQMMLIDIYMSVLTGSVSLTLYAPWDTLLPSNLEDEDVRPELQALPQERLGLTSMSACLCSYHFLYIQRLDRTPTESRGGCGGILEPTISMAEKERKVDSMEAKIREKFLQYCEPLEPLQVHMQIVARSIILAGRRVIHQLGMVNAKVSDVTREERDKLLQICVKSLEYNMLGATTQSIKHFAWHNDFHFPWVAFVYVVIESYHRYQEPETQSLWTLIEKVYETFPWLISAMHRPEVRSAARLMLSSWRLHENHLKSFEAERPHRSVQQTASRFVSEVQENLAKEKMAEGSTPSHDQRAEITPPDVRDLTIPDSYNFVSDGADFWNLEMIDWSYWESLGIQ